MDYVCQRFYSTCTANTLPKKLLKSFEFQIGEEISNVKYADGRVLLAKEETV